MNKPTFKIENWSIGATGDIYTAPELRRPCLQGNIYGHPEIEEGGFRMTSAIVGKAGERLIETRHTIYELGVVDPKWVELYPDAENRFFKSLGEKSVDAT